MSEQQTNLLLVEEVERHAILYNYYLPGYSKKNEIERAWMEVGNVVNLTAEECKNRWKNIRTVFVRHMKHHKSGSGTKDKKAYYLADAMQFTVPYIKALRKASGNLSQLQLKEEELSIWDSVDDDYLPTETPLQSPSPQPPPSSSSSTSALPQHRYHRSESNKHHTPKRKRAVKNDDATSLANSEQVDAEPKKEALKMFLLSMLPDLMQMDDQEVRQFKRKTLDIVDEMLSAKSARPPSSCPPSS